MITEREHRQHIVDIGRRMYESGMVAATDGNISVRQDSGAILTTPTM
ncbi:MAG: class II aldolase/adducin family protein, partial [Blastocatellia bacterium]